MFQRPERSYDSEFNDNIAQAILADIANPLCQIVAHLPEGCSVLDIGAGNGILGWLLQKQKNSVIADAIEPSIYAAKKAKKFYRKLYVGYAQNHLKKLKKANYDYFVLADVLEHMIDPLEFLKALTGIIHPETKILVSFPNAAHGSVRLDLLDGRFDYTDSGILERTHLRFLTLAAFHEMVAKTGLHIEKISGLQRSFEETIGKSKYKLDTSSLYSLIKDPDALAYQYFIIISKKLGNFDRTDVTLLQPQAGYWKFWLKHRFPSVFAALRKTYKIIRGKK